MKRKRVLLFCHDGMGLGHLRRISRLAQALQRFMSTLVVTGMREATWIVPPDCGLVVLPDWDGIHKGRAMRRGRAPWIDIADSEAVAFRSDVIHNLAFLFKPDLLIVDYLPYGQRGELERLLSEKGPIHYFLHRGFADKSDALVLTGLATQRIGETYQRVLVACDSRLIDVAREDGYSSEAASKITYVGFIGPDCDAVAHSSPAMIVCSGGGGNRAEELMRACVKVAEQNPELPFTVVLGPRSTLLPPSLPAPSNCKVLGTLTNLPELHSKASVVISSGGYNSLMEAAFGGARVIVFPSATGDDDEQRRFADKLSQHYPVRRILDLTELEAAVLQTWQETSLLQRPTFRLAHDGAEVIASIARRDLGCADSNSPAIPVS